MLGTRLGIPLSTTHCMVGSLFGIVLAKKLAVVNRAYDEVLLHSSRKEEVAKSTATEEQSAEEMPREFLEPGQSINIEHSQDLAAPTKQKDESSINLSTVKKILFFWALTVPVALLVSYMITALLLLGVEA